MTLRKITLLVGLSLLVVFLLTPAAYGLDPHFVKAKASVDTGGQLVVDFKLAGIGNKVVLDVAVSAHLVAVYNNGTIVMETIATGQFPSGKNGQITGAVTVGPPEVTGPVTLESVTYTDVTITATGAGTRAIPGTFTRTF